MAAIASACGDSPLDYTVAIPEDLVPVVVRYEARFFESFTCSDLALEAGKIDLALTSTPSVFRTSTTFDGFPPEDLTVFKNDVSLEVRAFAADGTMVARRCLPVGSSTQEAGVALAPFAPEAATSEVLERIALVAGASQRPARVKVLDKAGKPAERVLVSIGADRPLLVTGPDGIVSIKSSTHTVEAGTTRTLTVLGIPGSQVQITAESVFQRVCPMQTWSREVVPGVTGASIAIAAADAGPRTLVALLRPSEGASATNTLELLSADEGATSLRSIVTATTSAAGPVAISADRITGRAVIALVSGGSVLLYDFDGTVLSLPRASPLGVTPGGSIDGIRAIALAANRPVFAAFGDVASGAVAITSTGAVSALLPGGDRVLVDLALTEDGAYATTMAGLERFASVGGVLTSDGPVILEAKGTIVPTRGGAARALVFGEGPLVSIGDTTIDRITPSVAMPAALSAGDLNGDGIGDLFFTSPAGASVVLVSSAGRLLDTGVCPLTGSPKQLIPLPLDRGGAPRWLVNLDQTGRMALLVGTR